MPKIIDICFISGRSKEELRRNPPSYGDKEISIEEKIITKIKEGWELKGEIAVSKYATTIVQTMVKYEVTATVDLLGN
jgi:hypothetical protein